MGFNSHFRLGNYILYNNEIVKIDIDHLRDIQIKEGYRMLPIDDELLYKLGFSDEGYDLWINDQPYFTLIRNEGSLFQYYDSIENIIGKELFYVHELQNRVYSITEEELFFVDERPVTGQ
jgi:hypothetical protein